MIALLSAAAEVAEEHHNELPIPPIAFGLLSGFDFRICQMRSQVSTNRKSWQRRWKSGPYPPVFTKSPVFMGFWRRRP